jgi:hypothetical protein
MLRICSLASHKISSIWKTLFALTIYDKKWGGWWKIILLGKFFALLAL